VQLIRKYRDVFLAIQVEPLEEDRVLSRAALQKRLKLPQDESKFFLRR
jgi:hypothetical protein